MFSVKKGCLLVMSNIDLDYNILQIFAVTI